MVPMAPLEHLAGATGQRIAVPRYGPRMRTRLTELLDIGMAIEAVDRVMRGEGAPSPAYEGEDGFIAWLLGGPKAEYTVPLPENGEPKHAILDTYTKELEEGQPVVLDPPAVGRLGELQVPVLAIVGLLDLPATSTTASMLVDGAPNARRIDLPDVAHLPSLERPTWFTETLRTFLDEVDAAG